MPCRSDYLEPTPAETYRRDTAILLEYVLSRSNSIVTQSIADDANNIYGGKDYTKELCETLKALSEEELNTIVYNAKIAMSRRLADWWENHQEVDAKRLEKEKKEQAKKQLLDQALAKLTKEEREALGYD